MDRTVRSIFEAMRNYGSMNEGVNAVDRIEKSVPVSVLQRKVPAIPGLTYKTPYPPELNDGHEMTWGQKLVVDTKETIRCGNSATEDKYAPGAFRIRLLDCDCMNPERSHEDAAKEQRFGRLFNAMLSDKSVVLDFDFRECVQGKGGIKPKPGSKPWTYDDFESRYGELVDVAIKQEKEEAASAERTDKGYEVIEIKDFDMAMEFGKYTGGPNSESQLCYTTNKSTMEGQFGGLARNRVWLAYKPDFKDIEPVIGEGCPYDEYGLSMIWVFVGPDGSMPFVNVRWNHYAEHKGVRYTRGEKATDHCLSMKDVVDITGHSFEDTFKPYKTDKSEPTIVERLPNGYSKVIRLLYRSEKKVGEEYNICKGDCVAQPISAEWFKYIRAFNDKYAKVVNEQEQCNLLSYETGEIVFGEWLEYICKFNGKYAGVVNEKNQWKVFSYETGELLSDEWFRNIREFNDEYAIVANEQNQWNLLSYETGELFSDEWVRRIRKYNDNYAEVENEQGQFNLLSYETGEFAYEEWFRNIREFNDKYARVTNEQWRNNLLSYDTGEFVFDEWFNDIYKFNDKHAEVENEQKQRNLLSYETGKIVFDEWVSHIYKFNGKNALVENGKWRYNLFSYETEEFVLDEWFKYLSEFNDKHALVENEQGRWNLISYETGELLFDEWFISIKEFNDEYAIVANEQNRWNLISCETGELLSDEWFKYINRYNDKHALVKNEQSRYNLLSYETEKIVFDEWFRTIREFNGKYALVNNEQWRYNLLSYETKDLVFDEWFRNILAFDDNYARVEKEQGQWNLISYETKEFVFDEWFESRTDLDVAARQKGIYKGKNESRKWRLEGRIPVAKTAVCECCGRRFSAK